MNNNDNQKAAVTAVTKMKTKAYSITSLKTAAPTPKVG